jgi:hypothetical protein
MGKQSVGERDKPPPPPPLRGLLPPPPPLLCGRPLVVLLEPSGSPPAATGAKPRCRSASNPAVPSGVLLDVAVQVKFVKAAKFETGFSHKVEFVTAKFETGFFSHYRLNG